MIRHVSSTTDRSWSPLFLPETPSPGSLEELSTDSADPTNFHLLPGFTLFCVHQAIFAPWSCILFFFSFFILYLARYPNLCLWMPFSLFASNCLTCSLIFTARTFSLTVLPSCAFTVFLWNVHWDSLLISKLLLLHVWIPDCLSLFSTLPLISIFMFLCFHFFSPYIEILSHVVASNSHKSHFFSPVTCNDMLPQHLIVVLNVS